VSVLIPVSGGPGIIEFSVPHTNFWEDAGTAVVEVLRHDGAEGTVEVSYSTRDGDAVAGLDYTATRGTLTFGPGETSKTVMVSLLDNPRGECNRQLSLSLSNARGGAFLYGATNVAVFILEDELASSGSLQAVAVPANGFETGSKDTAFSGVSADGRWVAFSSWVDLVPDDTNQRVDVFLKDLQTGEIRLASANRFGQASVDGYGWLPLISADGRYVAFVGYGTDLVTNQLPEAFLPGQVFVRDMREGTTRLVSVTPEGQGADWGISLEGFYTVLGISSNGQMVAFLNDGSGLASGNPMGRSQLFVRNVATEQTILVTRKVDGNAAGNGETREASLSADGRYIAFSSYATDLVDGALSGVFLRDLTGTTNTWISPGGSPVISADGRYIAFQSFANGIVSDDSNSWSDVFVADRITGVIRRASGGVEGPCDAPSLSADGRHVAFRGGAIGFTNSSSQIYVHDGWSNSTTLVSVNCHGTGPCNMGCFNPVMSADGRYAFFQSYAMDLVPGEFWKVPPGRESGLNVFRRDLRQGTTLLITQNRELSGGGSWNSGLATPRGEFNITPDGNLAVVASADDLVYEDANGFIDLLVWRAEGRRDSRPRLTISREDVQTVVRWPAGATDFVPQTASDAIGSAWTDLPFTGTTIVIEPAPGGGAFFRLEKKRQ
jgi:Tol biopolymer transport system component